MDAKLSDSQAETHDFVGKIVSDRRKTKKPLMEKLRRDRINNSLNEMKMLVLESLNKDVSRYSKMEKADILEMTVKFLKEVNRQERVTKEGTTWSQYRAGYQHCAMELMQNCAQGGTPLTMGCHGNVTPYPGGTLILANTASAVPTSPVAIATGKIPTVVWVPLPSPPPSPSSKSIASSAPSVIPLTAESKISGLEYSKANFPTSKLITSKMTSSSIVGTPTMWRPW